MKTTFLSASRIITLGFIATITSLSTGCYTPQSACYYEQPAYATAYNCPVYRPVYVNVDRPLPAPYWPVGYVRPICHQGSWQSSPPVQQNRPTPIATFCKHTPSNPYAFVNY
jgi:hypothetical protein